jgi:hypothetical protein
MRESDTRIHHDVHGLGRYLIEDRSDAKQGPGARTTTSAENMKAGPGADCALRPQSCNILY